ncbi:MAG: hypothetical protein KAX20_02265 [Candidatus Omnitrophica bacterium]|nr:hypothetical protein [Candidatus Omnitrophota bacterium]
MDDQQKKNYRIIFWKLFGIGMVLNMGLSFGDESPILSKLEPLFFIGTFILLFFWMKCFNESWKLIGKKHGWALGLVPLIPFGPLIAIAIAHHYLKGTDCWRGKYKSFHVQK